MRQGALHVATGLALGVGLGGIIALTFRQLHDTLAVAPWDPAVVVTVTLVLLLCAGAASLLPAHRATRVDPLEALRYE